MTSLPVLGVELQRQLFPRLEEELGPLTALDVEFSAVLALADLGRFARRYAWCGNGAPPHAVRFRERSASERVNSRLKERYGGRWVRVRGGAKVMCPLMFGVIALTASALFARIV